MENTADNHADYPYLKNALEAAERFLKQVNENVRLKENHERLDWMQTYIQTDFSIEFDSCTNKLGPRKLLHFGYLTKVKSGKELLGFLLNDFLLLVQPSKSITSTQFTFQRNNNVAYKVYKQAILIQDLKASKGSAETVEYGTDSNRVLRVQDKKQIISLLAPSVNECNLWLKRVEEAEDNYERVISLMKPALQPTVGPLDKKRQDCINELIQTEKAYIDDMRIVHKIFEIPLLESQVVDKDDIEGIFVNWREILQCNKNFLDDLLERTNSGSDVIGDIICSHLPRMTAYVTFCSKQLDSAALLQKLTETSVAFRDVVKRCQLINFIGHIIISLKRKLRRCN